MQLTPRTYPMRATLGGLKFLYNPNAISDSYAVTYNDMKTAGMSYPALVYGGGERRNIMFEIYLNDKKQSGATMQMIRHLKEYLPKPRKTGYQFQAPKSIRFAYGTLVEDCYLTNMDINYTAFSTGNLIPIEATLTVQLTVIQ